MDTNVSTAATLLFLISIVVSVTASEHEWSIRQRASLIEICFVRSRLSMSNAWSLHMWIALCGNVRLHTRGLHIQLCLWMLLQGGFRSPIERKSQSLHLEKRLPDSTSATQMSKTRRIFGMRFCLSTRLYSFSLSDLPRTACLHRSLRARMLLQGWILSGRQWQMCSSWKVLSRSTREIHDLWIGLCENVWLQSERMHRTMCHWLFLSIGSLRSSRQHHGQPVHPTFAMLNVDEPEELIQSTKFHFLRAYRWSVCGGEDGGVVTYFSFVSIQ